MAKSRRLTSAVLATFLATHGALFGQTKPERSRNLGTSIQTLPEAIKRITPSIVQIRIILSELPPATTQSVGIPPFSTALGTGFYINNEGYVITAKHVLDAFDKVKLPDKQGHGKKTIGIGVASPNTPQMRGLFTVYGFDVVDSDPIHDLVLLKVQPNNVIYRELSTFQVKGEVRQPVRFFESSQPVFVGAKLSTDRPNEGESIAVSGYPLGKVVLITTSGTVASSWGFDVKELHPIGTPDWNTSLDVADVYYADVRVNGGNSGGPVYSVKNGAVIGVCVSFANATVQYGDLSQEPVIINNVPIVYNSGVSLLVPALYVSDLLKKNNIKWIAAN